MTVQTSDLLVIERGGVSYQTTAQDVINFMTDNVGTSERVVANITARDALTGLTIGDRVEVTDASADATVNAGWAIYTHTGAGFKKVAEEEGLDVVVGTSDLGFTRTATNGTVTNSNGLDATIPGANATLAGLFSSADFNKLSLISATAAVDLDALDSASHDAVTTQGTATTNPIQVTGQELSFSISSLSAAP